MCHSVYLDISNHSQLSMYANARENPGLRGKEGMEGRRLQSLLEGAAAAALQVRMGPEDIG